MNKFPLDETLSPERTAMLAQAYAERQRQLDEFAAEQAAALGYIRDRGAVGGFAPGGVAVDVAGLAGRQAFASEGQATAAAQNTDTTAVVGTVGNDLKTDGFAPAQRIALLQIAIEAAYYDRNRRDPETVAEYFNAFAKLLKAR